MKRWVELGAVLLLGAVAGLCNDQKPAAKTPPPPRPAPVKPPAKNNAAKGGVPKAAAQRLVNPAFSRTFSVSAANPTTVCVVFRRAT